MIKNICIICNLEFKSQKKSKCCSKKCYNKNWDTNNKNKKLEYKRKNNLKRRQKGIHAYFMIKDRCNNLNNNEYKYYGGKGVKCLLSKEEFLNIYWRTNYCEICNKKLGKLGTSPNPSMRSIDRINNNGNYDINNVRIVCLSCNVSKSHETRESFKKICSVCGIIFVSKFKGNQFSNESNFCSNACYKKDYYFKNIKPKPTIKICPVCYLEYKSNNKKQIFCSRKCKEKDYYRKNKKCKNRLDSKCTIV
jgi:hypothetical protein